MNGHVVTLFRSLVIFSNLARLSYSVSCDKGIDDACLDIKSTGPEVIQLLSSSTQLSMDFQQLIKL